MTIKFIRRNTNRYSRLGNKRKKLQKWRKPNGRDNKMRLRQKGYLRTVEIGYRQNKEARGKVNNMNVILIKNLKELEAVKDKCLLTLGKVGKKKKIEIARKAAEKNLEFINFNAEKLIKQAEKEKPKGNGKQEVKGESK